MIIEDIAGTVRVGKRCRQRRTKLLAGLIEQVRKLSKKSELAGAIRYALSRWTALARYRDDGSI